MIKQWLIVYILFLLPFISKAQQVYPVSASSQLIPPNSLYLSDYYSPGGNLWQINLNLLDFVEPLREVYLKITVESNAVSMVSIPNVYPQNGVFTLLPGQQQLISGNLLEPYFEQQYMVLSGMTWSQLQQNGRLPEGFYTFCIEVIDVYSGEILSVKTCNSAWLRLNDQPLINTPFCGNVINTTIPLNIPIQWQSNNLLSPNSAFSTEYQLSIYEVTDLSVSPINAANNGNIIQVFQSNWLNQPQFLYDISSPSLTVGKCYVFTVQARDISGRDLFKNNGFSEFCWFYYGYPEGGILPLIQPQDSAAFAKFQPQYFRWGAAGNFLPSQPIEYELTIVEVDSTQNAVDAVHQNNPWHLEQFPVNYAGTGLDYELPKAQKTFTKGQRYAWKVRANSSSQLVAESPIYTFLGPPLVDGFYVNNHFVEVLNLTTSDLSNLSGTGRVKVNVDGTETALMTFENISLINLGGVFFMNNGYLEGEVESSDSIDIALSPIILENGNATASFKKVRLSAHFDLDVQARVAWDFPLVINATDPAKWTSGLSWYDYTGYQLNGNSSGAKAYNYALLDPYGFTFIIDSTTSIAIYSNSYGINLNGKVQAPSFVEGVSGVPKVTYLFADQNQPFYIQDNKAHYANHLTPIGEMNVKIKPVTYTIDLSNSLSPPKFQNNGSWMGIYINSYELNFSTTGNSLDALQFSADIEKLVQLTPQDSSRAWITTNGLSFLANENFTSNQAILYNTFPGQMEKVRMEVENSALTNSYLEGSIKIPFLSTTQNFGFTVPMTTYGYNQGYLNESMDSTSYTFNPGSGDNEIFIDVHRAVFADNQKLILNVGIDWPGMDVSIDEADGFMIWGNYNVGFGKQNGVLALQEEVEGEVSDFEILVRYIGMGRDANLYSIGLNGEMQMGEDVSGDAGAPEFNGYSIHENSVIPENYTPGTLYGFGGPTDLGGFSNIVNEGGGVTFGDTSNSDLFFAMNAFGSALAANNADPHYESGNSPDSIPLPGDAFDSTSIVLTPSEMLEKIVMFLDVIAVFMPDSAQAKVITLKQKLQTLQASELYEIYLELEQNGFDLQRILKAQVDKAVTLINDKINNGFQRLNTLIENTILSPVDSLVGKGNKVIEDVIDRITEEIIEMIGDNGLADALDSAANTAKIEITTGIRSSVLNSVKTNVTDKITVFIDTVFKERITEFITEEVTKMGYAIIDQNSEGIQFDSIVDNADSLIQSIGDDVLAAFQSVSMGGVVNTCKSIVDDAVDGVNWPQIGQRIKDEFLQTIGQQLATEIVDQIVGQFGDSLLTNSLITNLTENFEFDFSNLGDKLANGDIGSIVKFDPSHIKIQSKVVDLEGMITFKEDSIWGECWQALLHANIKKPKEIGAYVKYINGKVNDYNYWFCELAIDRGLNIPFVGGTVLDGIGGKVFKHMKYVRNETNPAASLYLPTDTVNFGAGLGLWIIDGSTGGETLKLKVDAEVVIMDDDFELQIRGKIAVKSKDKDKNASFDQALTTGEGFIGYSTINRQLIGAFNVTTKVTPLLCASGELGLNVYPGFWNVYAGKKETPIITKLLCENALAVNSWFDISNTHLQFGVESQFDFSARSPWFKIGPRHWSPYASFGWHFLAELDMEYKPAFIIHNAQILMHIYAGLGVAWENRNSAGEVTNSGDFTFVSVELYGNVQYSQNTVESKFQGQLAGNVTVLSIDIGFDVNVNKSL